ncbi:MAG: quinone-dependent dihydroorotate dehydrogenase [Rhodospirillaceae bacterium]|nr:quinone-dependent dihydroorotate dehydrogenase [Rhodospirillaceae bacterium]
MTLAEPAVRLLRLLPPEAAHRWTVRLLRGADALRLPLEGGPHRSAPQRAFGLDFPNPVGLAAGFDKDAEAVRAAFALGFGFVEVGSVTPQPQPGNPRPRVFRLPEDGAVINRYGFNSKGLDRAERRLAGLRRRPLPGPLGVNLGANRASGDPAADYATGARRLAPYADYLVVNVSSPNTPGLRALQDAAALRGLLEPVQAALEDSGEASGPVERPLLLKVAPDLEPADIDDIARIAQTPLLDGLIVCNTPGARPPGLRSALAGEAGGLSGRPLMAPSTAVLGAFRERLGPDLPIIGVGGIASSADAAAKRAAGATLIQLYTGLIYEGPALIRAAAEGFRDAAPRNGVPSPPREQPEP